MKFKTSQFVLGPVISSGKKECLNPVFVCDFQIRVWHCQGSLEVELISRQSQFYFETFVVDVEDMLNILGEYFESTWRLESTANKNCARYGLDSIKKCGKLRKNLVGVL